MICLSTFLKDFSSENTGPISIKFHMQPLGKGGKKIYIFCPGPEVIKLFSCSTQLSMKFFSLIYVKMPTIVGILTCMSGKNNILGLIEP